MNPSVTITGELTTAEEGSYVYLPFEVPAGTTAVRVRYCHDQPENAVPLPAPNAPKHVLDLGLYDTRPATAAIWGESEFRGSGGSSVRDVTVAPNGFSPDSVYEAGRKNHVTGFTTRAYVPGETPPGQWAVELGVAAVASQQEGDADGTVAFKVRIETSTDAVWSDPGYEPTPYDPIPANASPGWYAGDFHVHGEQEPGNATMRETFDYAFAPYGGEGAGLDFVTLVDHNNVNAYDEIGRYQPDYPDNLIIRSTEVTTYRGHLNNHASGDFVDYRTGPLYEAELTGTGETRTVASLERVREPLPASSALGAVRDAGGFTQINHPTIFPSAVPTFDDFCRGCSWEYSDQETDYSLVDAIEVATGPAGLQTDPNPGPNPFTPLAIQFWEDAIDSGGLSTNQIAAVGSSDSHRAIKRSEINPVTNVTDAPIGMATTVVYADELSETGVAEAVRDGHTYVKLWGADGPDLRLEASSPAVPGPPAIIGDTLAAETASFTARVLNLDAARIARPGLYTLHVFRDGEPFLTTPIPPSGDEFSFDFESLGPPARYRLQVQRAVTGGAAIESLSSPIYLDPGEGEPGDGDPGNGDPGGGDPGGSGGGGGSGAADVYAEAGQPGGGSGGSGAGAGRCGSLLVGSKQADRLIGTAGSDRIRARAGRDRLKGKRGADCLSGGKGADRIDAGKGTDRVRGGSGDDRIRVADGKRDRVDCGPGRRDRVRADRSDRLRRCERVRRSSHGLPPRCRLPAAPRTLPSRPMKSSPRLRSCPCVDATAS